MPELPDVENFRRYLERHVRGKKIEAVEVRSAKVLKGISGAKLGRRLEGRSFERTRRHGKHLFAALDDGGSLGFHFGLTGCFAFFREGEDPKHERVRFDYHAGEHLAFVDQRMFGRIEWVDDADAYIRKKRLGADALTVDEKSFLARLERKRGALKAVLMDQSVVAGVGNVYSDEILFQAKLHPKTPAESFDAQALKRLYRTMRRVLETAIEKGAGAEDLERRVPKRWLLPHRSKGAACPVCGGKVAALKLQGRTAYYCPACQPAARGA
jgi:formamidopyrimidine-DNA glycosylase